MRPRFFFLGFIFCGLSLATWICALPAPEDLKKAQHRRDAARPTPTPTAAPLPAIPVYETTPLGTPPTARVRGTSSQSQTTRSSTIISESATPPGRPSNFVRAPSTQTVRSSARAREPGAETARPSTVVVIDAGHGGFDRGGIPGQRVPEKVMTLDVAQRLKAILTASGYRVVMTRDSDVFIPLPTRVAIANSYRNGIFICIHFNAATRSGANGIETYFYSRESLPLASAIHYYVAGGASTPNRGVRRRGYYVLRRTTIPAILVECGFLTNASEAQVVQSALYRQRLAEEIARGIRNRGSVAASSSAPSLAGASAAVPLQPFIDQTHVRDPDLSRHSSKRSSKSKSSKSKKSSTAASSTKKKHVSKSADSDDESSAPKKKKSSKTSED